MSATSRHLRSQSTRTGIAIEAATARSIDLMEAIVAAGALMAYADGEMAAAERRRLLQSTREMAMLASFSQEDIAEELAVHEANFRFDPELAQVLAREKLAPVAGNPRSARVVLEICRRLARADGVAHPGEHRALAEIAGLLARTGDRDAVSPASRLSARDYGAVATCAGATCAGTTIWADRRR